MKEKKHRVEDALRATQAALEGIVPGGGVALLNAQDAVDTSELEDGDEAPEPRSCVARSRSRCARSRTTPGSRARSWSGRPRHEAGRGLNAESGDCGDLIKDGVIDPTMVTRSALQNSASIAKNILTTGRSSPSRRRRTAPAAGGGMPDMGG
jgi:chaperonin GroEL